jgi:Zn-dependent protease with chaperone function
MNYEHIRIKLEQEIGKNLWELFEGDVISRIMKEAKVEKSGNYYKYLLEGHSFKLGEDLLPELSKPFNDVCEALNFTEPVEFFISNSPDFNASAASSQEEDEPHLVNLNSGLVNALDEDELRFVIGHELGHIISKNIDIKGIIEFIFPKFQGIPLLLYNKISLWDKLSELTADRYGLIACGDPSKCVSAFFKMSSGLSLDNYKLNLATFLEENEKLLESFRKENTINVASHPMNPIRIKALEYFAQSKVYGSILDKTPIESDPVLISNMQELTNLLLVIRNSELDQHRSLYIASAGLVMAGVDEQMKKKEYELIVHRLAAFLIFPEELLQGLIQQKSQYTVFVQSASTIMQYNPAERDPMFEFLISVAMSDNELFTKEIDFLYDIGAKLFKYSPKEIAQKISHVVRGRFIPRLY